MTNMAFIKVRTLQKKWFWKYLTFLYFRYFCSIWSSMSWKNTKRVLLPCTCCTFSLVFYKMKQFQQGPTTKSTLYSCVPGVRVLIFEPNWTNISVMAPILSWRALYSSYSAQKSSWYCCRCSSVVTVLYFLKSKRKHVKLWKPSMYRIHPLDGSARIKLENGVLSRCINVGHKIFCFVSYSQWSFVRPYLYNVPLFMWMGWSRTVLLRKTLVFPSSSRLKQKFKTIL